MASLTIKPRTVFQLFCGTVEGQCMGGCKQMLTADDKDHSFCNKCWDSIFARRLLLRKSLSKMIMWSVLHHLVKPRFSINWHPLLMCHLARFSKLRLKN